MALPKSLKNRDLVILGLLMDQPRYGYEVKVLLDNALAHLVNINSGSLYYSLKQLLKLGYVEEAAVEKIGRRPERSIYQLTAEGKHAFLSGIEQQIFPITSEFNPLDLALYFIKVLDLQSLVRLLAMRQSMLISASKFFLEMLQPGPETLDNCHRLILQHKRAMIEMEIAFIEKLLLELPGGRHKVLTTEEQNTIADCSRSFKQMLESGLWADKDLRLTRIN